MATTTEVVEVYRDATSSTAYGGQADEPKLIGRFNAYMNFYGSVRYAAQRLEHSQSAGAGGRGPGLQTLIRRECEIMLQDNPQLGGVLPVVPVNAIVVDAAGVEWTVQMPRAYDDRVTLDLYRDD